MPRQPDRPVRLTFPAREPGARRIVADGVQVGHVLADHRMVWTAYCWRVPGRAGEGFAGKVVAVNLALLRGAVKWKLEREGPWWSETAATG